MAKAAFGRDLIVTIGGKEVAAAELKTFSVPMEIYRGQELSSPVSEEYEAEVNHPLDYDLEFHLVDKNGDVVTGTIKAGETKAQVRKVEE